VSKLSPVIIKAIVATLIAKNENKAIKIRVTIAVMVEGVGRFRRVVADHRSDASVASAGIKKRR
jgi:hypothetical protein